ncbi:MAG: ankyrin repeat domain-containing protein [Planctomycetota bacterium]
MKRFPISMAMVLVLVAANANVSFSQSKEDIHQAAIEGDTSTVKSLLDGGADVNGKNRLMGYTPLHGAVRRGRKEVVDLLLSKGADINAKEKSGKTPLFLAAEYKQKAMVELLLAKGADVNVVNGRGDNALSIARTRGNTEITDILLKNGATEPVVQDMYGDEYYGADDPMAAGPGRMPQRGRAASAAQAAVAVDLLADPNEISATLKTFDGLEKLVVDLAKKSSSEMRYWGQSRYDNRTSLARAVQKQVEEELAAVRKIAVEEKAQKTTAAIDELVKRKQARYKLVNKELLQQRREMAQSGSSRSGGRGRSSGRSRGRSAVGGDQAYGGPGGEGAYDGGAYGRGAYGDAGMGRTSRSSRSTRPAEQIDAETQDEIRQWLQATPDNKAELAKSLHPKIHNEIALVRQVAVEEEAKKTVAAIDGILLARKVRHDVFVAAAEQLRMTAGQGQDPRMAGRYGDQTAGGRATTGRTRGRTRGGVRGGTTGSGQQQNVQGGRTRRR